MNDIGKRLELLNLKLKLAIPFLGCGDMSDEEKQLEKELESIEIAINKAMIRRLELPEDKHD